MHSFLNMFNSNNNNNSSSSILITDGSVTINGKTYEDVYEVVIRSRGREEVVLPRQTASNIFISVEGNASNIHTSSGDVTVRGYVTSGVNTMSGDVVVNQEIRGHVQTMSGNVQSATSILGEITTMSGSVTCQSCRQCKQAKRKENQEDSHRVVKKAKREK